MRTVMIWLFSGIFAGIWLGIANRIAMRFVAIEAGTGSAFSMGGSIEVVAFGAIVGTPVALIYWILRRNTQFARWIGAGVGILLFSVFLVFQPPAARSAVAGTPDTPFITALLFFIAFASFGVLLDFIWYLLCRRTSHQPGGE